MQVKLVQISLPGFLFQPDHNPSSDFLVPEFRIYCYSADLPLFIFNYQPAGADYFLLQLNDHVRSRLVLFINLNICWDILFYDKHLVSQSMRRLNFLLRFSYRAAISSGVYRSPPAAQ